MPEGGGGRVKIWGSTFAVASTSFREKEYVKSEGKKNYEKEPRKEEQSDFFARLGNNFFKNSWKMQRQNIADLIILEWGAKKISYYEYCQHVAFSNYFSNATNPAINIIHP